MKNQVLLVFLLISFSAYNCQAYDEYIDNYCLNPLNKQNCEEFGLKLEKNHLSKKSPQELKKLFTGSHQPHLGFLGKMLDGIKKLLKNALKFVKNVGKKAAKAIGKIFKNLKHHKHHKHHSFLQKNMGLAPIDFRKDGKVRKEVVDTKNCNAFWAIAAAEVAESLFSIKYASYPFQSFSSQEVIDCAKDNNLPGTCDLGSPAYGITYYLNSQAAVLDKAMPFKDSQGACAASTVSRRSKAPKPISDIKIFEKVTPSQFYDLLKNGPIAVVIDATDNEFMFYSQGILKPVCDKKPSHSVLVFGYGEENGKRYWLIKNNIPGWGIDHEGVAKLYMSEDYNSCGMYEKVAVAVGY